MKRLIIVCVCLMVIIGGVGGYFLVIHPPRQPNASPSPTTVTPLIDKMALPPAQHEESAFPASISAQAVAIYDVASGQFIFGKNEHERLMPASTTKMMTALVAQTEYDPEETVVVTRAADAIGHAVDLNPGEKVTVRNLIEAMLINSGNDAAVSLADHHAGGYSTFINLMNQRAITLGLKDTHFSNVSGVEADDHYSSAYDLSLIANELMKNQTLKGFVGTKEDTVYTTDKQTVHKLKNLNELLWTVPGVIGVKTGWTEVAGDCLATYVTRNGHDIITVVLKSQDRFADSTKLIEWVYSTFKWVD